MQTAQNMFHGIREYLNPLLKDSKFVEEGVLTPEEFVLAGDYLVYKFPTWSWETGEESKRRDYLPPDKQFLITRNVPCERRAADMDNVNETLERVGELDGEEEWVQAFQSKDGENVVNNIIVDIEDEVDVPEDEINKGIQSLNINHEEDKEESGPVNIDDIPDIDDEVDDDNDQDNPETEKTVNDVEVKEPEREEESNLIPTRTYDVSITYDKYYRTPRIWLYGYDESRRPLSNDQVYEDISQDHATKTVTIDPHPHLPITLASIHPCKHASVMKKLIQHTINSNKDVRVDQYMLIFLKFISCVLPTIEYDHTASAD